MGHFWIMFGVIALLAAIAAVSRAELVRARQGNQQLESQNRQMLDQIEALDDRVWDMAASEALHRSLVETLGDLVVRRTSTGRILYANSAYAVLMATVPEALRGTASEPDVALRMEGTQQADGTRQFDELIRLADGQERWIAWVETQVALEGDNAVRQRVGRDVSGRVAAERQLEDARAKAESASEAKSRFLATVSHEFRTPLNGILGMSDLLNDTRLEPEQVAYVKALHSSGKALLSLVDEILDLTKVESGKLELADQPFDVTHLIEDVVELMAPRAQTKGLDIASCIAPHLAQSYRGDEERLRQILVNLVGNAIKFTSDGGVAVHARACVENGIAMGLEFRVEDTGQGIPAERLDAIFLEFEQASAETGRRHGGTGLGLAIVKRLVEAMGGKVVVQSAPGAGSEFIVTLPLPAAGGATPDFDAQALAGQHVLIITSSPFTGQAMAAMAQAAGAHVQLQQPVTSNGPLHLAKAPGAGWNAVIIDYAIGPDAAAGMLNSARQARCPNIIVALSAQERRLLGKPVDAGFNGHLVRPVRARSFHDQLRPARLMHMPAAVPNPIAAGLALHVLVAEDNEINALIVLKTLERHGCTALWARDGAEALSLAKAAGQGEAQAFDLVLMDVRMPVMDGLDATRAIRRHELALETARPVAILGISANVAREDVSEARLAGMDDCLSKPLDRQKLVGWLERIAAGKRKSQAA